ncbi:hypothetical protein GON26_01400 [Flavobacterium sp. GA093]|uniref:Uncharacterized protein n=1 Tax=Flavobacterium hydrocarbonoxydans TaxID=2683249 RepID=A0A6I4NK98_9FLAO|nr:hypothetical protein [Flavobacterium hydrocarbonoxydans]MWB93005.1 hypothetical protein [Flavobacterium hydrocarbonoxydans]
MEILICKNGNFDFSIILSGILAAKAGGSKILKAVLRICIWGTFAITMSALAGYIFGVQTT